MSALLNVSTALRDALAARRDELNLRFARARARQPKLDGDRVLIELADVLQRLDSGAPLSADLVTTIFDLVLLHTARDTLATRPGLRALFVTALADAAFRRLALARPTQLLPALSNAIENLGARGADFVDRLVAVSQLTDSVEALLAAGGVAAWSLGEPRLRAYAFAQAASLPSAVWLAAFGGGELTAKDAVAALGHEGWRHPDPKRGGPWSTSDGKYAVVARLGGYTGFGGPFEKPPKLVVTDADVAGDRHHFHVVSGEQLFRVDADLFGARIRPVNPAQVGTVRPALALAARRANGLAFQLLRDGTLDVDGKTHELPELGGATSYLGRERLVLVTLGDSYRVRVLAPT